MKESEPRYRINIIIFLSILIIIITMIAYRNSNYLNTGSLSTDRLGHFGDFIGGFLGTLLTLVATYYVFQTYISQSKQLELQEKELASQKTELKDQKEFTKHQQFENTFFNMLNVHRELKNNLHFEEIYSIASLVTKFYNSYYGSIQANYKSFNGTEVFLIINDDLQILYNFHEYENRFDHLMRTETIYESRKELFDKIKKFNTTHSFFNSFTIDDNSNTGDNSEKQKLDDLFDIIFIIHKNQISHYCRNVYHILKYIKQNEDIETLDKDKFKNYANIFQSQLNVSEQVLLFYNFLHFDNPENSPYSTKELVEHYSLLENVGIENLLSPNHVSFYNITFK